MCLVQCLLALYKRSIRRFLPLPFLLPFFLFCVSPPAFLFFTTGNSDPGELALLLTHPSVVYGTEGSPTVVAGSHRRCEVEPSGPEAKRKLGNTVPVSIYIF